MHCNCSTTYSWILTAASMTEAWISSYSYSCPGQPQDKSWLDLGVSPFPVHLTGVVYHHPADLGRRMDKLPDIWGSAKTHSSFFAKIIQVHKCLSLQSQTPDQATGFFLLVCLSERVRCVFPHCKSWASRRGLSGYDVCNHTSGSFLCYNFCLSFPFVISLSTR